MIVHCVRNVSQLHYPILTLPYPTNTRCWWNWWHMLPPFLLRKVMPGDQGHFQVRDDDDVCVCVCERVCVCVYS